MGLFLVELKRQRQKLLKDNTAAQAHQQRTITTFFSSITPTHATSLIHIDWVITISHAHRSRPSGDHGPINLVIDKSKLLSLTLMLST